MKKIFILLLCCFTLGLFGAELKIDFIPNDNINIPGIPSNLEDDIINGLILKTEGSLGYLINEQFSPYLDNLDGIIGGFGDASIFASSVATQRAMTYDIFGLSIGVMAGARIPGSIMSLQNDFTNIDTLLQKDFGANIQVAGEIGLNTSKFFIDDLYLSLSIGYFKYSNIKFDNLSGSFEIFHIGPKIRYNIIKDINLGIFQWGGIKLGTGFLYQTTNLNLQYKLDNIDADEVTITNPTLAFNMNIRNFIIPLEVHTSIKLLWFLNINAGIGADFGFGENKTSFGLSSDVYYEEHNIGTLSASINETIKPTIFNPKLMLDIGFYLGPVVIDVPLTYYFGETKGMNAGVNIGIKF